MAHRAVAGSARVLLVTLVLAVMSFPVLALEREREVPELSSAQRRDLNRLGFFCRVKIAEQSCDPARGMQMLAGAGEQLKILHREAGELSSSPALREMARAMVNACIRYARRAIDDRRYRDAETCLDRVSCCTVSPGSDEQLETGVIFAKAGACAKAIEPLRNYVNYLDPDGDGKHAAGQRFLDVDGLRNRLREGAWSSGAPERIADARLELNRILEPLGKPGEIDLAVENITAFRKRFPASPIDRELQSLREELSVRRKLVVARRYLAIACAELARRESERQVNSERVRSLCREGLAAADCAAMVMPRDSQLAMLRCRCLLLGGQVQKAADALLSLRRGLPEGSESWWRATLLLHKAYKAGGHKEAARKLVLRLRLEYPRDALVRFPVDEQAAVK